MNTSESQPTKTSNESSPGLCTRCVRYVREHPVSTVLGALATGMVVGWLLPHREPEWSEQYWRRPLRRAKGLVESAMEAAGDAYASAADYAADAYDRVKESVAGACQR